LLETLAGAKIALKETLPEEPSFNGDFLSDEHCKTVFRDTIGLAYAIEFLQALHSWLGIWQGQMNTAYMVVETLIHFGRL
jgi:hypothetical protein